MGIDSGDCLDFSRHEPLHPLLVVLVENDEEDGFLSLIPRTQRECYPDPILSSMGTILGEEPAGSLLCGFAFAFDRHQNLSHPVVTHILRNSNNICSAILSHTPRGLSSSIEYFFFSEPGPTNDHCPIPNILAYKDTSRAFARHSFSLSEHRKKWDSSCEILWCLISVNV